LTALEKILAQYGDAWVWCAFDPINKLLPVFVVGKRTMKNAKKLVTKLMKLLTIPFLSLPVMNCVIMSEHFWRPMVLFGS
jgi:hypothetical protein